MAGLLRLVSECSDRSTDQPTPRKRLLRGYERLLVAKRLRSLRDRVGQSREQDRECLRAPRLPASVRGAARQVREHHAPRACGRMGGKGMTEHKIGTHEEWQAARADLLAEEKELTRR